MKITNCDVFYTSCKNIKSVMFRTEIKFKNVLIKIAFTSRELTDTFSGPNDYAKNFTYISP